MNGPPDKAVAYLQKAVPMMEKLLIHAPADDDLHYKLWNACIGLAKSLGSPAVPNLGDWNAAVQMLNKCQPLIEQLAARHPENLSYQQGVGAQHNACGQMFAGADQHEQALEHYRKALEIDRAITTAESSNALFRRELAIQFGNVGTEVLALKNPGEALDNFKQALAIHESMVAADPNDSVALRNTGVIHRSLGTVLATTDPAAALNEYQNALRIFDALVLKDSGNADFRRQQAHTYLLLSGFHLDHGHATDALASAQDGIRIAEPLVTNAPKNAAARNTLALLDIQIASTYATLASASPAEKTNWVLAKDAYKKALALYREMKSAGTLLPADAKKPDEITGEVRRSAAIANRLR